MTYQVLARKWRPRDFASLVGQEHVVRALTHALEAQRLHHAYLFTGTRGVGKTTLSRILAKALNCESGITATPCGVCNACREIDEGRFVDYVEMDAASNRGVDEMAALLERAVYAPVDARFKVYMIDEVHMLTNHAFNSMLKTLEEPPPHVKFILATTDPQKIPVTVLSRCLQFNLKQMPPAHIVAHLERILGDEQIAFDAQALRLLARAAEGSMRDALSLTDQAIAYSASHVTEEAVRGMLGALDQSYLIRLLDAVTVHDGAGVLAIADEMASRSLSFSTALQDLSGLLHRIAWAQFAAGSVLDEWPEADAIRRFAAVLSPEAVQLYYQIATIGRGELGLAPDEYAGFTMTLLRMLAFRVAHGSAAAAIAAEAGGGTGGVGGAPTGTVPAAVPSPAMSSAAAPSPVTMPATAVPAPRARATAAAAAAAHDPFVESTSAKDPFAATGSAATATTATATAATAAFAVTAISAVSATTTGAPAATAVGAAATAAPAEHAAAQAAARNTPSRSGGPASAALNVLRGAGNRVSADRGRRPAVPARARAETGAAAQTQPPATTGLAVVRPAAVGAAATDAAGGTHTGHAAENRPAPHVRNATPDAASAPNADPAPWDARWDDIPPDDAYMPLSAYDDDPASPVPDERPLRSAPRREGGVLNHDAEVRNRVPPPGNRSGNSATALAGTASAPTGTAPTGTASAPTDTVPLPPAVSLAPLGFDQDWPALAASLTLTGVAYQLAFNSELTACEGRQLSLRVPLPQYAEAAQVARLKDALHARLGHPVELKVEIGAARRTAAALEAAARRLRQQEAEREIRQAPFVQSLIRDFDATIVPDSIRPLSNGAAASSTSNP